MSDMWLAVFLALFVVSGVSLCILVLMIVASIREANQTIMAACGRLQVGIKEVQSAIKDIEWEVGRIADHTAPCDCPECSAVFDPTIIDDEDFDCDDELDDSNGGFDPPEPEKPGQRDK